jgi:hypothetical protein
LGLVVSVVDDDGNAASDLGPSDFEITEGGSTRHPTRADRIAEPGSFLVLLEYERQCEPRPQPT